MAVAIRSTWEHFAHGADICGIGPTKEAAFEQIALALTGVITDLSAPRAARLRQGVSAVNGEDHEAG